MNGFGIALAPSNLMFCFVGVFLGTVVGIMPGLGPLTTIAILLPVTFNMNVTSAIIMLAGIYYGVAYGGTATSVLMRVPGEASTVVTCLDGYMMARKGRAGAALTIAAVGSFVAGTVGTVAVAYLSPVVAKLVFALGPSEYMMLMLFGLSIVVFFAEGSQLRAILMILFGVGLGCVGQDPMTAELRLDFGLTALASGIDIVPLAIGLFGMSELLHMARRTPERMRIISPPRSLLGFLPNREEMRRSVAPIGRGTVLGFFVGLIPGAGGVMASFLSYGLERRVSRKPEEFGTGAVEGLAGPEAANNSATSGAFLPLLCMGLPSTPTMAVLLSAFMIHGVSPGPAMMVRQPEIFWAIIASMYVGNLILLVLNVPLIGLLIRVLDIPRPYLASAIMVICLIGVYSSSGDASSVAIAVIFGVLGYVLRAWRYDLGLVVLAYIMGPILERSLRQALTLSDGQLGILFGSWISNSLAALVVVTLVAAFMRNRPSARQVLAEVK